MRQLIACTLLLNLVLLGCGPKSPIQELEEKFDTETLAKSTFEAMKQIAPKDSVLRHVVLFSFKPESTEEDIQRVVDAFRELQLSVPGILSFEYGLNNSPEGLNRGLTHAFTLTFDSEKSRDEYLPHPEHKAFGAILGPHLDEVLVVDYWARP